MIPESLPPPQLSAARRGLLFAWPRLAPRRINRHGELGNIGAIGAADLADTVLAHLVDAHNGMHGQIGAFHPLKLGLDPFFRGVHYHRAFLAEHQFFDLDETPQGAVADFPGVDLVNLALIGKNDFENVTGCHM